jgi:hypothetical protein
MARNLYLIALSLILLNGCSKVEKQRTDLATVISQSPVIFLCKPEGDNFVIERIYRCEPSWGSDIREGEIIVIGVDPKIVRKPFLVLRNIQQYVINGLGQSRIGVNPDGRLVSYGISLAEVEELIARDKNKIRSVPKGEPTRQSLRGARRMPTRAAFLE